MKAFNSSHVGLFFLNVKSRYRWSLRILAIAVQYLQLEDQIKHNHRIEVMQAGEKFLQRVTLKVTIKLPHLLLGVICLSKEKTSSGYIS